MSDVNETESLTRRAAAMLRSQGFVMEDELEPMRPGGNNRVYLARGSGGPWVVKQYFRDACDLRDRLAAEWRFGQYAWSRHLTCVPRPIALDRSAGLAAYEFVAGRALRPGEVSAGRVAEAGEFIEALAAGRRDEDAVALPDASEACFSLACHCSCVDGRVERLRAMPVESEVDQQAADWIGATLLPRWDAVRREVELAARALPTWDDPLSRAERVLSPSDFGFHNAILRPDGRLTFVDFEYAGWDDPAKLACDFFCQPAVPAPAKLWRSFAQTIAALTPDPMSTMQRMELLLPVYRIKWCCIMLNIFLPAGARRRHFAGGSDELERAKATQLGKARRAILAAAIAA